MRGSRRWAWLSVLLASGAVALVAGGAITFAGLAIPGGTEASVGFVVLSAADAAGLTGAGLLIASVSLLWLVRDDVPEDHLRRSALVVVGACLLVSLADLGATIQAALNVGFFSGVAQSAGATIGAQRVAIALHFGLAAALAIAVGATAMRLIPSNIERRSVE